MEVDLIRKDENSSSVSQSHDRRPPNVIIPVEREGAHRWKECKIIGKNISIRSYGAACCFKNKFYLYGGYQILKGGLNDFYSISLEESEETFNWVDLQSKNNVSPSCREKHALLSTKSHIFLIGGLLLNNMASNDIYRFDPEAQTWELMKPEGDKLPNLESFGATVVSSGGEERIIIAFGFNEETASPSNAVYEYNTATNKLSILFEGSEKKSEDVPVVRMGCALAADETNVYVFGGKNDDTRLNDLWAFSLTDFKFKRMPDQGEVPVIRNGHTLTYYDQKLYVFGGIHDITWELDDLHIYNLKTNKWTTLEQDSPRKLDKKVEKRSQDQHKEKEKVSPKKKGWYDTMGSNVYPRANSPNAITRKNFSSTLNEDGNRGGESPGKMLDEQRRKVFFQKKTEMLKNFEVNKEDSSKYVALETSSQAMKISLDVIGNPDPKVKVHEDRLTDFGKQSESKFLGPLHNSSNIIMNKKPCARDGHCAVVMGDQLIICSGDRHQMSFNDIYKLDLSKASRDVTN